MLTVCELEESSFFRGKSTISMAIFNSYVGLPEGKLEQNYNHGPFSMAILLCSFTKGEFGGKHHIFVQALLQVAPLALSPAPRSVASCRSSSVAPGIHGLSPSSTIHREIPSSPFPDVKKNALGISETLPLWNHQAKTKKNHVFSQVPLKLHHLYIYIYPPAREVHLHPT